MSLVENDYKNYVSLFLLLMFNLFRHSCPKFDNSKIFVCKITYTENQLYLMSFVMLPSNFV